MGDNAILREGLTSMRASDAVLLAACGGTARGISRGADGEACMGEPPRTGLTHTDSR